MQVVSVTFVFPEVLRQTRIIVKKNKLIFKIKWNKRDFLIRSFFSLLKYYFIPSSEKLYVLTEDVLYFQCASLGRWWAFRQTLQVIIITQTLWNAALCRENRRPFPYSGALFEIPPSAFVVHSEGREDKQVHMYKEIIPGLRGRRLSKHRVEALWKLWDWGFKATLDFATERNLFVFVFLVCLQTNRV